MKKLYVVVRKDLSKSQQAVQGGHALAEYILQNKDTGWDNGTLVYLGIRNEREIIRLTSKLSYDRIDHILFREPDRDDEITAFACLGNNKHFEIMDLI